MNCIRGTLLLTAYCNLLYPCIRRNFLHPFRGSHGVFLSDVVRVRHINAFDHLSPWRGGLCLSNIVSRSDVCTFVSMSALFKIVSSDTSWDSFLRRASWIHGSLIDKYRLSPDPVPVHASRVALLSEVVLTSAPVPICSKIWEVCFDVITGLDPSINSGGYPLSHARTRHDDAIPGKRLTMPWNSASL